MTDAPPIEESKPTSAPPSGAALSQAALFVDPEDATGTPEPEREAEPAPAPAPQEPEPKDDVEAPTADSAEDEPKEKPSPAPPTSPVSDAPGHTPRTDTDISASGSLFDL